MLFGFFILSFIPSLILYPSTHAYGVFIEWIVLPCATGTLLWLQRTKTNTIILYGLLLLSLCVSIAALLLYAHGYVTYDHRLSAFFLSPNHLAMFTAPLIFTALALFFTVTHMYLKILCITSSILCATTVLLTQSFSTLCAVMITALLLLFTIIKNKKVFWCAIIILVIIFGVVTSVKVGNSNALFERNSLSSRIMIWDVATFYIQKSPLIGYEIDSFQKHYLAAQPLYPPYLEWAVPTEHNIFLHFMISGGYCAVVAFCVLCAYVVFSGYTLYHQHKKPHIASICGAFIVIILCGVLDTPYWKNDLSVLFWIIIALIIPTTSRIPKSVMG